LKIKSFSLIILLCGVISGICHTFNRAAHQVMGFIGSGQPPSQGSVTYRLLIKLINSENADTMLKNAEFMAKFSSVLRYAFICLALVFLAMFIILRGKKTSTGKEKSYKGSLPFFGVGLLTALSMITFSITSAFTYAYKYKNNEVFFFSEDLKNNIKSHDWLFIAMLATAFVSALILIYSSIRLYKGYSLKRLEEIALVIPSIWMILLIMDIFMKLTRISSLNQYYFDLFMLLSAMVFLFSFANNVVGRIQKYVFLISAPLLLLFGMDSALPGILLLTPTNQYSNIFVYGTPMTAHVLFATLSLFAFFSFRIVCKKQSNETDAEEDINSEDYLKPLV